MDSFILLHRSKVSCNNEPMFDSILVNIKDIVAIEESAKHFGSEVHLKNVPIDQMAFQPLYCRESFNEILSLLKEKGVDIISP
ncbi:hypothetical protein NHN20_09485 [Riemerella anatipestifer]|uniref:hypothetical protein n=1 Tax=Riemerella anatipestifer TaxID=34085 RepID=UPI0020975E77|nr:hypothetical protein [Riemerella anatipestifer]MCO7355741.1 hypothetical protein [Riemerella anatipestifer]